MPISASWIALRRPTDLWKALFFAACGGVGGALGALISEPLQLDAAAGTRSFEAVIVHVGIWFGIVGAAIAAAILLGQSWYLRRGLRFEMSLAIGAAFGFVAGAVSGGMALAVFSAGGEGEVLRAICWGIAGGLLGLSLSVRIPNLTWRRGFSGGLVGGLMGGIVFIVFTFGVGDQTLGRLVGVFAIGFLIGLMILLADALFREAWLEVAYGHKERRTTRPLPS